MVRSRRGRTEHGAATHADEGHRGHRRGGDPGRVQVLLRLSHHPAERDPRVHVAAPAAGGWHLPPGRERGRRGQHDLRRRRGRRAGHDLVVEPRRGPHVRGSLLPRGQRGARGHRQHHARRPGPRGHPALAGRLGSDDARLRSRGQALHRPRAEHGAGGGRHDGARLRPGRRVPKPLPGHRRRPHRPDDGAGQLLRRGPARVR